MKAKSLRRSASSGPERIAEVTRGNLVESVHYGIIAVTRRGKVVLQKGNIEQPTFLRSSAKPFQAFTVLETGAGRKFGLTDPEVAVMCGSHEGDDSARKAVGSILRKIGLSEQDLRCGVHSPTSLEARDALIRRRRDPTPIYNNCSGKHAGMLAACLAMGWPIRRYLDPSHPLQKANLETLRRFCGVKSIPLAVDGCSAPTFAVPLWRLALGFERLLTGGDPSSMKIRSAMARYPELLGETSGRITRAAAGELIAKGGAEGVLGVAVPEAAVGIAIKCLDGSFRPHAALLVSLCRKLKLLSKAALDRIQAIAPSVQKNLQGVVSGKLDVWPC